MVSILFRYETNGRGNQPSREGGVRWNRVSVVTEEAFA